jgi:hypothetical protein
VLGLRLSFSSPVARGVFMAAAGVAASAVVASAQTTIAQPDTSQTTVLTATVTEQARVTVPSGVTFAVTDVGSATASTAASITISNIVLASATRQLKVSLQADAAGFSAPVAGATTWSAGDVTWAAAAWTGATATSGTLSNSVYNTVATCDADAGACSTSDLIFTLAAKSSVKRSGNHTLTVRWKVESIGS